MLETEFLLIAPDFNAELKNCSLMKNANIQPSALVDALIAKNRVGRPLATQVADWLEFHGGGIRNFHRDYCGIALFHLEGHFVYGQVGDWGPMCLSEFKQLAEAGSSECRVFSSRTSFIDWLADLSSSDLNGDHLENQWLWGNQRISIAQLRQEVAALRSTAPTESAPE